MRVLSLFLGLWFISVYAFSQQHPSIYVSRDDRAKVLSKIEKESWAKEAFAGIRAEVEKYADRHQKDPEWIVSRLAMYWKEGERYTQCYLKKQNWDRGEGNAPVPTVRMPGMRTWNKYINVPLEDRIPYNETGDMLGVNLHNPSESVVKVPYKESGHMIRGNNVEILTLAEKSAFLYWVTKEEKFASFASDIFNTWLVGTYYMNPILDPEKSCGSLGGWEPGGICGYYDYEQIHDDLVMHSAIVYDFLFDYLMAHPHPHLAEIGKDTKEVADEVFKRFINIGMVRGGKEGNWNVNGWNMLIRPILVLGSNDEYADGKGREYYLHYLTKESTKYHEAIPDMVKNYDLITGLWPESPGYSFGTVQIILEWCIPLKRAGIDIMKSNPILRKAAMAVFPWMDDLANMVVFGDSRGGSANFRTFESLLAYYTLTGCESEAAIVAGALHKGISMGKYNRNSADWVGVCLYTDKVPKQQGVMDERASYSQHHRFITMKNWEGSYKMMANLYGGRKGYHLNENGLALQLYAYGYAMAPDAAAYESYWSKDYGYHQSPTGVNTILPGYKEGEIIINAMEPMVAKGEFVNTDALTPFLNFSDVSAGEKRRTVAVIRTSKAAGYYLDIFRSDLNDNDYLFHHLGNTLKLTDTKMKTLSMSPQDSFNYVHHPSYHWFKNLEKIEFDHNFVSHWQLPDNITARLWMTGAKNREIFRMCAPPTTLNIGLTPHDIGLAPALTPTLLVRQTENNAESSPFMAVYDAYKGNSPTVSGLEEVKSSDGCKGLKVTLTDGCEDYIFSAVSFETLHHPMKQTDIRGNFAFIRKKDGHLQCLYLGNGTLLRFGKYQIKADKNVYATIYWQDGEWYYSSTGDIEVFFNGTKEVLYKAYQQKMK